MRYIQTAMTVDPGVKKRLMPFLRRNGMTFSSFVRKTMADTLDEYEMEAQKKKSSAEWREE